MECHRGGRSLRAARHPGGRSLARPGRRASGSTKPRAPSRTTACASAAIAAAACFRRPMRPAGRPRSTTTSAPSTRPPRSAPIALCWWSADCRKGSRDIGAARQMVADGIAAVLPHARAQQDAARDRAAASDVCRRPRLREHARAGARHVRAARRRRRRRDRHLSRVVGSGPRGADRARGQGKADLRASRLRLAGADQATCCSTAA